MLIFCTVAKGCVGQWPWATDDGGLGPEPPRHESSRTAGVIKEIKKLFIKRQACCIWVP